MLKDLLGTVVGTATKFVSGILPPLSDKEQAIENLLKGCKVCYLGSVDDAGFPCIKAMLFPRGREGVKRFYFSTNTSAMRTAQFRANRKACLYFCDEENFRGVMLQGTIDVLEDPAIKQLYWREGDTIYYPQGVTDPDYCVLAFVAQKARYYGNLRKESFDIA